MKHYDAIIIGGGFFGCMIGIALRRHGFTRVLIAEKDSELMYRSTRFNQARVHRGYHYPRDTLTALRSAQNYQRFIDDFYPAVRPNLAAFYAIARNSKVMASQFENFCHQVNIPLWPVSAQVRHLVDSDLVSELYRVEETVFDCSILKEIVQQRLKDAGVEVATSCIASGLHADGAGCRLRLNDEEAETGLVFNATYSAIDQQGIPVRTGIKREWVEIALIRPPADLRDIGITIMDGPFFSVMPYPSKQCHTLTHVRYTPLMNWHKPENMPKNIQLGFSPGMRNVTMQRDAARYIPSLARAEILGSFLEVKSVLTATEDNDARPILFEKSATFPGVYSVLGAKIDNIYDIVEDLPRLLNLPVPHSDLKTRRSAQ